MQSEEAEKLITILAKDQVTVTKALFGKWKQAEQERDKIAAQAKLLNALIVDMQTLAQRYIVPEGISQDEFVIEMIGLLDGPQQRAAQAVEDF